MDDLISRKALLEQIEQQRRTSKTGFPKQSFVVGDAINCIRNAPAVETEHVLHGRWIQVDDTKCRCSECEVITLIAQYPHGNKNYCPNCGAKMDLEV